MSSGAPRDRLARTGIPICSGTTLHSSALGCSHFFSTYNHLYWYNRFFSHMFLYGVFL